MKKIIAVSFVLVSFLAWKAMCATQPQSLGVISASVKSLTAAQIALSTSTAKGELVFCSDCITNGGAGTICVSTATIRASFVLSSGTVCK